jgi:putative ABC transport system permease protein
MSAPSWRRYLRFWGKDIRGDLEDELDFHIESRVRDYVAAGMEPNQARALAHERFGNREQVRRSCELIDQRYEKQRSRADMWGAFRQDLRYAGRNLGRNPGFTAVAVLTLILGIGANSAIFSVVNGVLLRPLPYRESDRLVRLFTAFHGAGEDRYSVSQPEFMDYKGLTALFENTAAYTGAGLTLTGDGEPQRIRAMAITRDFFPVLGIAAARGRTFEGEDGRQGVEPVVLVTHEFWQSRLGADPAVVGRSLTLNGVNRRVIGILPPGHMIDGALAFIPLFINPDSLTGRASNYLSVVARLKPGVTIEQTQQALNVLTDRLNREYPTIYPTAMGHGATVVAMRDEMVGDIRPALLLLQGAVGLVLLIACVNVANLLLARGEARQREIAVRLALGASRKRVVFQLLTESGLLALLGAAGGVLLAWWGTKALLATNPEAIPRVEEIRIDTRVALATLGCGLLASLIFGLTPAIRLTRPDLNSSLRDGSRGGSESGHRQRLGRTLVAAEVALAMVVVIGAALLIRSFWTLRNVDPGFRPDRLLAVDLSLPQARYNDQAATDFYRRAVERMAALPGVQIAAASSDLPPISSGQNWDVEVEGRTLAPGEAAVSPNVRSVTRDYFKALSIPLVRGRLFGTEDNGGSLPVAVINETTARELFPRGDPVGQRIRYSSKLPWITVIGVVGDVRSMGLRELPPLEVYLLHEQLPVTTHSSGRSMYLVMRTGNEPLTLATAARGAVRELDPLLAITAIRTVDEMMDSSVASERFTMLLLGGFGAVALALAAIGVYGVMAYAVKRRTREIGIRMALGARPADVIRLVVGQGMRLAVVGVAFGAASALLVSRLMAGLLYGISPTDPLSFVAITLLLAGVALVASWLPARRAVLTRPTEALAVE